MCIQFDYQLYAELFLFMSAITMQWCDTQDWCAACSTPVLRKALEKAEKQTKSADVQFNMWDPYKHIIILDTEEYHTGSEVVWSGNKLVN